MTRCRLRCAACCFVLTQLATFSAHAQTAGQPEPALTTSAAPSWGTPGASVLATPTRAVVFTPDRPDAELQRYGIGLVNGIWVEGWVPVCVGRCATAAPLGERYRVAGSGIRQSKPFAIGPGPAPLQLSAKTGLISPFVVGVVAIPLGGVALGMGVLVAGFADLCGMDNPDPHACDSRDTTKAAGLLAAGLGAAAVVTGILLVTGNKTSVAGTESGNVASRSAVLPPVRVTLRGIEF